MQVKILSSSRVTHVNPLKVDAILFYRDINHGLNDYIGIKTRTQLRKKDFDKADDFIQNWTPSTATLMKAREISLLEDQQQEAI